MNGALRTTRIVGLAMMSILMSWHGAAAGAGDDERPHLQAALDTAMWLRSVAVQTEHGIAWPADPEQPDSIVRHLYNGTPGVILFFVELHRATGDSSHLDDAKRGSDDLLAAIPKQIQGAETSLWTGVAGQGFTLHQVYKATGEQRYLVGATRCVELLKKHARPGADAKGVEWNDTTDIIRGSAGIGLFLLYAAREMEDPAALELAAQAGDRLVAQAKLVEMDREQHGLKWAMTDEFPRLMPNFSHGTAGVCYFLATLHQQLSQHAKTVDERYLNAALAGARYLLSIADTSDNGCVIFHHEPEGEGLYYLGWCHGPVGTSRLFYRLAQVTDDDEWMQWVTRGAHSVLSREIDAKRTPGFWNNIGQCCGSAGVASFFLHLHALTQDAEYAAFAQAVSQDIMQRSTRVKLDDQQTGSKWSQAEHRVRPELLQAQTGFMQGAAGIGLWFLQLDAYTTGREFGLHLPDSPF
ncbi:MAG: lanthionine synthetase LanC family protein [Phycisphaerales bacterium]